VASPVPDNVSRFIRERLPSAEQLQILLLLHGDRERSWTAPEVAAQLGTPPESTAMRLFLLASNGILGFESSGVPRYRYAASDSETDGLIKEVVRAYEEDQSAVLELVGGATGVDPLRSFSDAFKLKR
jgi:hypothetical protein